MSDSALAQRFFHPFLEDPGDGDPLPGTWQPKTLSELRMCSLSAHIRQKPNWWEKMRDETIRSKWIREAKEQQAEHPRWEQLTDNMLNYVMSELNGYAMLRDAKTGIESGPYERIFLSDTLIPEDLTTALKLAVKPLEDVPESNKDCHPGSDGRVLDLVHPSICPLVFYETWGTDDDGKVTIFKAPESCDVDISFLFISERFQWLPSDFSINKDGAVKLESPYINNISPNHHDALVPVIEQVMQCAVPLWERVLSSLRNDPVPARVIHTATDGIPCIWSGGAKKLLDSADETHRDQDYDGWLEGRLNSGSLVLPEAHAEYRDMLKGDLTVTLSKSTIQVIVKPANIVLTPEKPEYPGGIWHVEGMATESIVSTFVYYYESDNIEACDLSFRNATEAPHYHEQDDSLCIKILYGISLIFRIARDEPCIQDIGSVETKAGRSIAFPNLYQHRVSPFKLSDPTKPGVRKILVFFLQLKTVKHTLRSQGPSSRLSFLPVELLDYIATLVPGVKSRAQAEVVRGELMKERSILIKNVETEFFEREFNVQPVVSLLFVIDALV
ncbi:hypothetical protein B0H17DRAFT_1290812 [Mycena rosella]|uniref:Uncharacterized protein n=1 Tax=Mycena rosella TaxID=1033263 RepID=A0AAD7DFS0_MYCRO|nr:hypothetical protein B0H17DRAFT_1290812 [Mycena rosella]